MATMNGYESTCPNGCLRRVVVLLGAIALDGKMEARRPCFPGVKQEDEHTKIDSEWEK